MDDLYRENILEHYKQPRNFGELPDPDLEFEDNNPLCGDEVDLFFPRLNVAVEVQSALHDNPTAEADDLAKKARLERRGVRVLWIS